MSNAKNLIEYIAQSMVGQPEQVAVDEIHNRRGVILTLTVAPEDMGRIIGKGGRMANAMRALLRVAAVKSGDHVTLEIGE